MIFVGKFVYLHHHFILLQLNPFDLRVDQEGWFFSPVCVIFMGCQQRVLKTFPCPGYLHANDGLVWLWHLLVNLYIWLTISFCYPSLPFYLGLMGRDGNLSTLCNSFRFPCQQSVLETLSNPGYFSSEDGAFLVWYLLVNLHILLTIHSCYGSMLFTLGLIKRDGGFSTIYYSCGFAFQQGILKTFPEPGYYCSEDGVAWLSQVLVNLHVWLPISSCYGSIHLTLVLIGRHGCLSTLCNSHEFAGEKRMLKFFPGPGSLYSTDGLVWVWYLLLNLYIWLNNWSCND